MKNLSAWVKGLSLGGKIGLSIVSLFLLGGFASAFGSHDPSAPVVRPAVTESQNQTPRPSVETKTITETEAVPFEISQTSDSTLDKGVSITKREGQNGVRTLTYKVTYTDGQETNRELLTSDVTTQPTSKVVAVGTKVALSCPSGTYVNSAGATVCSPYSAPSAPDGATAKCRDGTYSFSQSRSGTCSHHGGVAQWL
jgi:hypothetical protein